MRNCQYFKCLSFLSWQEVQQNDPNCGCPDLLLRQLCQPLEPLIFHFEYNLEKIFNRDVPATEVGDRIYAKIDSNTTPWIFLSDTIEEA